MTLEWESVRKLTKYLRMHLIAGWYESRVSVDFKIDFHIKCDECFEKDAVWQCYECGVPRAQGKSPVTPVLFCDDHRDSKLIFSIQGSLSIFSRST